MVCFIWFLVGLFVGAILGFMFAALIAANAADDLEPDGVDDVLADTLAELRKQQAEIEESKSKQTLTFNFGSLDELRKRQQERLDSEAWKEDMEWDARQYEAEQYEESEEE